MSIPGPIFPRRLFFVSSICLQRGSALFPFAAWTLESVHDMYIGEFSRHISLATLLIWSEGNSDGDKIAVACPLRV
jgi:hypothetical protein